MTTPIGRATPLSPSQQTSGKTSHPDSAQEARAEPLLVAVHPPVQMPSAALRERQAGVATAQDEPNVESAPADFTSVSASHSGTRRDDSNSAESGNSRHAALRLALNNDQALTDQLIGAIRGRKLDLSQCAAKIIEELPPQAWSALHQISGGRITKIVLPDGIEKMPDGIENLSSLARIKIRSFNGVRLAVPAALSRTDINLYGSHYGKIMIDRSMPDGKALEANVHGRVYIRESPKLPGESQKDTDARILATNLNGAVKFPDPSTASGNEIVCRHLSVLWLLQRLAHHVIRRESKGQEPLRFNYDKFSSELAIGASINPAIQTAYEDLMYLATENFLFPPASWPDFLQQQLQTMDMGNNKHFLISTAGHAMALELRCKPGDAGQREYVVNFYDPNITQAHFRIKLDRPEQAKNYGLKHWLSKENMSDYFRRDPPLLLLIKVDPATHTPSTTAPRFAHEKTKGDKRNLTLIGIDKFTGPMLDRLIRNDFHETLNCQLASLPEDRVQRIEFLTAKDRTDSTNGLYLATLHGLTETVRVLSHAILNDKVLTPYEKSTLFLKPSVLECALVTKRVSAVTVLVTAILQSNLSDSMKIVLLTAASSGESTPPFQQSEGRVKKAFLQPFELASKDQFSKESRKALAKILQTEIPPVFTGRRDQKSAD